MNLYQRKNIAFTLMELLVVIIILGIIAAFAIPSYRGSLNKAEIREAFLQAQTIHSANKIYFARNNTYLAGSNLDLNALNTELSLGLIPGNWTYDYDDTGAPTTSYKLTITKSGDWSLVLTHDPLSSTNPSCSIGLCSTYISHF